MRKVCLKAYLKEKENEEDKLFPGKIIRKETNTLDEQMRIEVTLYVDDTKNTDQPWQILRAIEAIRNYIGNRGV